MLFRVGSIYWSRPWRLLSRRPRARLVTLMQAYPACSKEEAQARAYDAWRRSVAA